MILALLASLNAAPEGEKQEMLKEMKQDESLCRWVAQAAHDAGLEEALLEEGFSFPAPELFPGVRSLQRDPPFWVLNDPLFQACETEQVLFLLQKDAPRSLADVVDDLCARGPQRFHRKLLAAPNTLMRLLCLSALDAQRGIHFLAWLNGCAQPQTCPPNRVLVAPRVQRWLQALLARVRIDDGMYVKPDACIRLILEGEGQGNGSLLERLQHLDQRRRAYVDHRFYVALCLLRFPHSLSPQERCSIPHDQEGEALADLGLSEMEEALPTEVERTVCRDARSVSDLADFEAANVQRIAFYNKGKRAVRPLPGELRQHVLAFLFPGAALGACQASGTQDDGGAARPAGTEASDAPLMRPRAGGPA